jgi:LacI family transcriptional regulator
MKNSNQHKLTLEDVARLCGVSRSTVSRVVNEHPNVSSEVRKRVLKTIKSTGFQPHAAARSLASRQTWMIGLILPHSVSFIFTDPYFSHLIKGIAQACNQHNYTLALFLVDSKEAEEKIFPRVSHQGFLDGVVVQAGHDGDQRIIGRMVDQKIPMVVAGRPIRSDNVSYIDIDNISAAYNAVSHLIRLGRKRIGTITGPTNSTVGIDRLEGYRKSLQERGRAVDESLIIPGDFTEAGGYYAMKKMLVYKPDAVFVASDVMAGGAVRALHENNLKIPGDVAIVGFDDLPMASYMDVQLTTIRQPVVQFGARAVELLIEMIEQGISHPRHVILDTELVIRKSCGVYES